MNRVLFEDPEMLLMLLSEMPPGIALYHWGGVDPEPVWEVMSSEGYGEFSHVASGATVIEALERAIKTDWSDPNR